MLDVLSFANIFVKKKAQVSKKNHAETSSEKIGNKGLMTVGRFINLFN